MHRNHNMRYLHQAVRGIIRHSGLAVIATLFALLCLATLSIGSTVSAASSQRTGGGGGPSLTISSPNPATGPAGTHVIITSNNWPDAGTVVTLSIGSANGDCIGATPVNGATGTVTASGFVQISFTWPALSIGTYPVCGYGSGASTAGIQSDNTFKELSQSAPSLALPSTGVSGAIIAYSGMNWLPPNTTVQILQGDSSNLNCASPLGQATSGSDGTINGTFTAPSFTSTTTVTITAISPVGTCSGSAAPTLTVSGTMVITPSGNTGTATPGTGNGTATPLPSTSTPTPGTGSGTPTSTSVTPTATGTGIIIRPTKTATPGGGTVNPIPGPPSLGLCPPLPSGFCTSTIIGIPCSILCLIPLLLSLLIIALVVLFARRRNEEVVVSEEDITSQIDPASVAPMGANRFVRAVRVTTQIVDRQTGTVRRSRVRVFDEFVDGQGATQRRPHV